MKILSLGEKIKKIRKEKKMTLKDLAGGKVTQGQISLIESGKSNPSINLLEYLAEKLEVPMDYLVESEKEQVKDRLEYLKNMFLMAIALNNNDEAMGFIKEYEDLIDSYENEDGEAYINYLSGVYYENKGEVNKALAYYYKALIKEKSFKKGEIVDINLRAADITYSKGAYSISLKHLLAIERYLDDNIINSPYYRRVYFKLTKVHKVLKNFDEMEKYLKLTIDKLMEVPSLMNIVKYTYSRANVLKEDSFRESLSIASQGVELIKVNNYKKDNRDIVESISNFLLNEGDCEGALTIINNELKIANSFKDSDEINSLIIKLVKIKISLKNYKVAYHLLMYLESQLENMSEVTKANYYLILGEYYEGENLFEKAILEVEKAYNIAKAVNSKNLISDASLELSKLYLNCNEDAKAKAYLEEYIAIEKLILS